MVQGIAWLVLSLAAAGAHAEELGFPEVWKRVEAGSAAQGAARLMAESAAQARARAGRHWLPKLYLDARGYSSNDPASAFMGLLGQRSVGPPDFLPDALNHSPARVYSRAALGLDLPVYQGGAGVAAEGAAEAAAGAKSEEAAQVRVDQYAEAARAYGAMAALGRGLRAFREMQAEVRRLQRGYRLGSKANPVGYSGALGMSAVANKLAALVQQYAAQLEAQRSGLRELGVASETWSPEPVSAVGFSDRYLAAETGASESHRTGALRAAAEMSGKTVSFERGKALPRLGLFAEGYGFHGNRATATGYSAGVYLRWNLFDPADFGSVGEAKLRAAGAERYAEAAAQEERAAQAGLGASLRALRASLELLAETEKALKEQAEVTETLFRNGSINALQLVEVVNRRAELAAQRLEAELAYLRNAAEARRTRKADPAKLTGNGAL